MAAKRKAVGRIKLPKGTTANERAAIRADHKNLALALEYGNLKQAARRVLNCWETGDLAAAVTAMGKLL